MPGTRRPVDTAHCAAENERRSAGRSDERQVLHGRDEQGVLNGEDPRGEVVGGVTGQDRHLALRDDLAFVVVGGHLVDGGARYGVAVG